MRFHLLVLATLLVAATFGLAAVPKQQPTPADSVAQLADPEPLARKAAGRELRHQLEQALGWQLTAGLDLGVMDALVDGLDNPDTRRAVETFLGEWIQEIIDDSERGGERRRAFRQLEQLVTGLSGAREEPRLLAGRAVEKALTPVIEAFAEGITDRDPRVRRKAAHSMEGAFEELLLKLGGGNLWARKLSEGLLGEVLDAIESALGHRGEDVRLEAAQLGLRLWDYGTGLDRLASGRARRLQREILETLMGLLQGPSPEVKIAAAQNLGEMGEAAKAAVRDLENTARDRNQQVARAAQQALQNITGTGLHSR